MSPRRTTATSGRPTASPKKRWDEKVPRASRIAVPRSNGDGRASGGGEPLDSDDCAFFERRFGRGFADVRVHHDRDANDAARAVRARAYTLGSDIVFATGEYHPRTPDGRQLLAHELAHVVRQHDASAQPPVLQRQPEGQQTTTKKTLQSEGRDVSDPVFSGTAQIIDDVLQRNQTLAPYIGDRIKKTKIAEKGKFIKELSDGNFENSYRSAYDLDSGNPVPSHFVGFYDSKTREIHLRPDAEFGTALHEAVHKLASPALYANHLPAAQKVSNKLAEVLKEGVTAYFTDAILKEEELPAFKDAYSRNKKSAANLVAAMGADGFDLLAKFNFKGTAIMEIGRALGMSDKQITDAGSRIIPAVLEKIRTISNSLIRRLRFHRSLRSTFALFGVVSEVTANGIVPWKACLLTCRPARRVPTADAGTRSDRSI